MFPPDNLLSREDDRGLHAYSKLTSQGGRPEGMEMSQECHADDCPPSGKNIRNGNDCSPHRTLYLHVNRAREISDLGFTL